MKKQNLIIWVVMVPILLSASAVFAQKMDMKPMPADAMSMDMMHKSPHHKMMMAYEHNAQIFARTLWDMTSDGKIEDIDLARAAFGEIMQSMEKMEAIHQKHMTGMGKMDPAMEAKMKPMMEKMVAEAGVMKMHMMMLEKALQAASPDPQEISMHAGWVLLKLEKMNMPEHMTEMPGKMPM